MKYFLTIIILLVSINSCTISYPSGIIAEYPFNGNLNDYKRAEVAINNGAISFANTPNTKGIRFKKAKTPTYLELPNITLSPDTFTISMFINVKSFKQKNSLFFYASDEESWKTAGLYLYTYKDRLAVLMGTQFLTKENYDIKSKFNRIFLKSEELKPKTNYYITLTYNGTDITLYVNAKEYATYPNVKPFSSKRRKTLIGVTNNEKTIKTLQCEGVLDEIKIFNKALGQKQISTLYKSYKR